MSTGRFFYILLVVLCVGKVLEVNWLEKSSGVVRQVLYIKQGEA